MPDIERETPFCRQSTRVHHGMHKIMKRMLGPCEMGLRQSRILMTLAERGEVGQRELYDLFHIDRAVVTKSLQVLEESGYVVRERDSRDRRRYILRPTQAGADAVPVIVEAWRRTEALMTLGMGEEEKETALAALTRLGDNVQRALDETDGEHSA